MKLINNKKSEGDTELWRKIIIYLSLAVIFIIVLYISYQVIIKPFFS